MLPIFDRKQFGLDAFKPYLERWKHLACLPDYGLESIFWPKFTDVEKDYYQRKVKVTNEQIEAISNEPQGTEAWLDHRFWRISMSNASHFTDSPISNFGSLNQHLQERFDSIDHEGKRKRGGRSRKKASMEDGHKNEPLARAELLRDLQLEFRKLLDRALQKDQDHIVWKGFRLPIPAPLVDKWKQQQLNPQELILQDQDILACQVRGLRVLKELPFLGASSDGELTVFGMYKFLLEIKCPHDPKKLGLNIYTLPKLEHLFQTQGCMYIHDHIPMTLYQCRAIRRYTLQPFMYDQTLCRGYLLPNWTNAYCTLLFPQLVRRAEQNRIETQALQSVFKVAELPKDIVAKKGQKRKHLHDFFASIATSS